MTAQTPALSADQALEQANAIATAATSSVDSSTFVFFAAFDGTNNGANPPADGSGDSQTTAVKQLFDQVLPTGLPTGNKGGAYEPGVGSLGQTTMQVDDRLVNLAPGMAVTAEIKTGSRRIIEYLLSPLLRHKQQALREQ